MSTRQENDSMGTVEVSQDKYWGAQTQRSLKYFSIGQDKMPLEQVHAMAMLKKAAAMANHDLGRLSAEEKDAITKAADEIIAGQLDAHFPLHVWMTGSGTQCNMNVNEVIANRAIEMAGGTIGSKDPIHPNDHVNQSQSSNDTFPTGMHIATAIGVTQRLLPALQTIIKALDKKATEWSDVTKIGRTHMQDAVPMTLGQEFSGYRDMLVKNEKRLKAALPDVYELAIGGTAIGTGLNAPKGFAEKAAAHIADITQLPFVTAPNKFEVQGSHDALVAMSGAIRCLAGSLFKIANDIRLLSCGPRAGFNELIIPANEPGSSIMPGKVNPTQCEAMAMCAAQVMGYDTAVGIAGSAGYLEMNVYKPMMIFNIIQSIRMLSDCCENFSHYCLEDMTPNHAKIDEDLHNSLMLVTALSPKIGYDKASEMAHYAHHENCSLLEANQHFQYLSDDEFKAITDPYKMTKPNGA